MKLPIRRNWVWLAACGAAFLLGVQLSPRIRGHPAATRTPTASAAVASEASRPATKKHTGSTAAIASANQSWLRIFEIFHSCREPLKRNQLLTEALAAITVSNWESAWQPILDSGKEGSISKAEWTLFVLRIGAVGRDKLVDKGRPRNLPTDPEPWKIAGAVAGWAAEDLDGCWKYISSLPDENHRREGMEGWFAAAATQNPERALSGLAALDPEKDSSIWRIVAHKIATHDPQKVKAWLAELSLRPARQLDPNDPADKTGWIGKHFKSAPPNGEETAKRFFDGMLISRLLESVSDPAYATKIKAWFEAYDGSSAVPPNALGLIATRLQKTQSASEVLKWIGNFPDSPGIFNAASNTVSRWTNEKSADNVTTWLEAHRDSPAYDGAAAGFSIQAYKFDPEGALVWANTIKDKLQLQRVLEAFAQK